MVTSGYPNNNNRGNVSSSDTSTNTQQSTQPSTQLRTQLRVTKRFALLTLLLLLATVFAALARLHWSLELFTHFTPYYALAAAVCAVVLALLGAWRWLILALALLLWNVFPVAALLLQQAPAAANPGGAGRLTVFHFNVGLNHEQHERIVSYLQRRAKEIDVVVLLETTNEFATALDDLKELYPYQVKHLEDTPFGIALASKHPIDFGAVSFIPSESFPHIEVTLKLPGRAVPLPLYAVHAPPPVSGELAQARNAKLEHVARLAAKQAKAAPIVVGDFNMTPWSPYFTRFVKASGLYDARARRRLDNTWPVTFDGAALGIAIDHSFAHPSLRLVKRSIGPDLGSDHLPVTVTFGY